MPLQVPNCENCGQSDAQITCIPCDANYCNSCDKKWHSNEKRKNHERIPYTGSELLSRFCTINKHETQSLSLYCQTCLKPICAFCVVGEHKNHPCLPLKDAVENVKTIIKDNMIPFQSDIAKIDEEIKIMKEAKKKLEEDMKKLDEKIKEANNRRNERTQKLEDLKSLINKKDADPYAFLSLVSELKLNSKLTFVDYDGPEEPTTTTTSTPSKWVSFYYPRIPLSQILIFLFLWRFKKWSYRSFLEIAKSRKPANCNRRFCTQQVLL